MTATRPALALFVCLAALPVCAQNVVPLRDLQSQSPARLSREELLALMPGAKMARTNEKGNTHRWSNDSGGEMVVSSDNTASVTGMASTGQGKWSISEDGRFCMSVVWKKNRDEESCRIILKTAEGYYGVNAMTPDSQKAHKLSISK